RGGLRLRAARHAGRPDGQDRQPEPLYRLRYLRLDPAHGRYADLEGHRRDQHRPRSADLQDRRLRYRRRPFRGRSGDDSEVQGSTRLKTPIDGPARRWRRTRRHRLRSSRTIRPASRTTTRSAIAAAAGRWAIMMMQAPPSANSRKSEKINSSALGSRAEVPSSTRTTLA